MTDRISFGRVPASIHMDEDERARAVALGEDPDAASPTGLDVLLSDVLAAAPTDKPKAPLLPFKVPANPDIFVVFDPNLISQEKFEEFAAGSSVGVGPRKRLSSLKVALKVLVQTHHEIRLIEEPKPLVVMEDGKKATFYHREFKKALRALDNISAVQAFYRNHQAAIISTANSILDRADVVRDEESSLVIEDDAEG